MTITRKIILRETRDIVILFALGFGMTATGITCRECIYHTKDFMVVSLFTGLIWVLLWKGNAYLTDYINTKVSWLKFPVGRFFIGVISTLVYTYLAVLFAVELFDIIPYTAEYNFGQHVMTSVSPLVITLVISLFMHGRSFLMHWRSAAIDAEKLKKENIAAKYESLKNQVNPHFLFNSFNALTNLVYEDQDKAVKFIKQLSDVYRYVLDTREKELVTLEEEKKFLDSYLFLQQIRFGEKLKLEVNLNGTQSMVAPLVLQMLVENAIKHNIVSEENPLTIRLYAEEERIIIENNVQRKMVTHEDSPGIGLDNICKRYAFLSDKKVEIIRGQTFVVKLPVIPLL
jgi:hypothetical protein